MVGRDGPGATSCARNRDVCSDKRAIVLARLSSQAEKIHRPMAEKLWIFSRSTWLINNAAAMFDEGK